MANGTIKKVPSVSKADKSDTVLDTTLSRGRKRNTTVGIGSFAFGNSVEASGNYSHAEGDSTTASDARSHAEGGYTTASGLASHAEGQRTIASGYSSHAEGYVTTASGDYSHAEGQTTTASGAYSHAEGTHTIASNNGMHACGLYNTDPIETELFAVGNGSDSNARSNAMTVYKNGTVKAQIALQIGSTAITETQLQQLLALLN